MYTFDCPTTPRQVAHQWQLRAYPPVGFRRISRHEWAVCSSANSNNYRSIQRLIELEFPLDCPIEGSLRDIAAMVADLLECEPTLARGADVFASRSGTIYDIGNTEFGVIKLIQGKRTIWGINSPAFQFQSRPLMQQLLIDRVNKQLGGETWDTRLETLQNFVKVFTEQEQLINDLSYHMQLTIAYYRLRRRWRKASRLSYRYGFNYG